MNLSKLFEAQRELDAKIIKEHNLENMDRLPYLILALQVELGECANEWRGFKYWSKDQKARKEGPKGCADCSGRGFRVYGESNALNSRVCRTCNGSGVFGKVNPLLEEYVDCMHFILSIGLNDSELMIYDYDYLPDVQKNGNITRQFGKIFYHISFDEWEEVLTNFLGLGEMLGFTWEQIEQAYYAKNQINHKRQEAGY